MSNEKKSRRRPRMMPSYAREGVGTLSEVSAFLGGIFFTALLLLAQQREKFDNVLLKAKLSEYLTIHVSQLHVIAIPLSISATLFVFASVFFAVACSQAEQNRVDDCADDAAVPFTAGLISMFISLFVILILVDIFVSVLVIILSIGSLAWWIKRRERMHERLQSS